MITTRLIGGLGNQMFQYAAGRALALRLGVELALDTSGFADYRVHAYGLDRFAIRAQPSKVDFGASPAQAPWGRLLLRLGLGRRRHVYTEKNFAFDPHVLSLDDGTHLDGYWQSERYFSEYADMIRRELTVIASPTGDNAMWLDRIRASKSVSMHVRRGDYVTNPNANAVHGTCDLEYYVRAARHLVSRLGQDLAFYVFSDDPVWVRENLHLPYATHYLEHNDATRNFEDLRLMANCGHHVIANSTFSWWGAWLNPSPQKIVVAPSAWFRTETVDTRDLIPPDWVRL